MDLAVEVDDERMVVLDKVREPLGLSREVAAAMLLRASLANPQSALHVIRVAVSPPPKVKKPPATPAVGPEEFERGWKGYAKAGGRLGPKPLAAQSWGLLMEETGWPPAEVVRRWALFVKLDPDPRYLPEVQRLLRPSCTMLTDDALAARAKRAKARTGGAGRGPAEFDADSYEETVARARAGSAPIPPTRKPEPSP